jgi:hypothetical protein
MKYIAWSFGVIFLCLVLLVVAEQMSAERIEVLELHATDPSGETIITGLWIVDHDGKQYLRVGSDGSGWFSRIEVNREIQLTRGDKTNHYRAVPDPSMSEVVNQARRGKYSRRDTFIGKLFGGRQGSLAIELRPI